ncbi:hypothetical protein D3C87_1373030 [compost metagenome]
MTRGTAWRCMFEPIRARLASSCSRKGIIAVATEMIWIGLTPIRSTSVGSAKAKSALKRTGTCLATKVLSELSGVSPWATRYSSSSSAVR